MGFRVVTVWIPTTGLSKSAELMTVTDPVATVLGLSRDVVRVLDGPAMSAPIGSANASSFATVVEGMGASQNQSPLGAGEIKLAVNATTAAPELIAAEPAAGAVAVSNDPINGRFANVETGPANREVRPIETLNIALTTSGSN